MQTRSMAIAHETNINNELNIKISKYTNIIKHIQKIYPVDFDSFYEDLDKYDYMIKSENNCHKDSAIKINCDLGEIYIIPDKNKFILDNFIIYKNLHKIISLENIFECKTLLIFMNKSNNIKLTLEIKYLIWKWSKTFNKYKLKIYKKKIFTSHYILQNFIKNMLFNKPINNMNMNMNMNTNINMKRTFVLLFMIIIIFISIICTLVV